MISTSGEKRQSERVRERELSRSWNKQVTTSLTRFLPRKGRFPGHLKEHLDGLWPPALQLTVKKSSNAKEKLNIKLFFSTAAVFWKGNQKKLHFTALRGHFLLAAMSKFPATYLISYLNLAKVVPLEVPEQERCFLLRLVTCCFLSRVLHLCLQGQRMSHEFTEHLMEATAPPVHYLEGCPHMFWADWRTCHTNHFTLNDNEVGCCRSKNRYNMGSLKTKNKNCIRTFRHIFIQTGCDFCLRGDHRHGDSKDLEKRGTQSISWKDVHILRCKPFSVYLCVWYLCAAVVLCKTALLVDEEGMEDIKMVQRRPSR